MRHHADCLMPIGGAEHDLAQHQQRREPHRFREHRNAARDGLRLCGSHASGEEHGREACMNDLAPQQAFGKT